MISYKLSFLLFPLRRFDQDLRQPHSKMPYVFHQMDLPKLDIQVDWGFTLLAKISGIILGIIGIFVKA